VKSHGVTDILCGAHVVPQGHIDIYWTHIMS